MQHLPLAVVLCGQCAGGPAAAGSRLAGQAGGQMRGGVRLQCGLTSEPGRLALRRPTRLTVLLCAALCRVVRMQLMLHCHTAQFCAGRAVLEDCGQGRGQACTRTSLLSHACRPRGLHSG